MYFLFKTPGTTKPGAPQTHPPLLLGGGASESKRGLMLHIYQHSSRFTLPVYDTHYLEAMGRRACQSWATPESRRTSGMGRKPPM